MALRFRQTPTGEYIPENDFYNLYGDLSYVKPENASWLNAPVKYGDDAEHLYDTKKEYKEATKPYMRAAYTGQYLPISPLDEISNKKFFGKGGTNRYVKDKNGEYHLESTQGSNAAIQGSNYTPGVNGGVLPNAQAAPQDTAPQDTAPLGSEANPLPSDYKTVANAQVGQWIKNSNGDTVQLTQEHIDWAKGKLEPAAPTNTKAQDKSAAAATQAIQSAAPVKRAKVANEQAAMRTQPQSYAEAHPEVNDKNNAILAVFAAKYPAEYAKYSAMSASELRAGASQITNGVQKA